MACSKKVEQLTIFKLYTLSQFTVINVDQRNFKYRDWLEYEFGISNSDYIDIVEYLRKTRTKQKLEAEVAFELLEKVNEFDKRKSKNYTDDYAVNVLMPYLWKAKNTLPISDRVERRIIEIFEEQFGLYNGKNGLKYLIESFNNYNNGGYFENQAIISVNESVKRKGYYLRFDLENRNVCLYDIGKEILENEGWKGRNISIHLIQRRVPCAVPIELGYSILGANDVVVLKDRISHVAAKIHDGLLNKAPELDYKSRLAERIWRQIGLQQDLEKGNSISLKLTEMEFKNDDTEDIETDLIFNTAVHEIKHKIDEIEKPEQVTNWDCEVSAHLTDIIYSNMPYYGLKSAIQRFEGFYSISGDEKIGELIKNLWTIAERVTREDLSKQELRDLVAIEYNEYRTYQGNELLNLSEIETKLIPKLWKKQYN